MAPALEWERDTAAAPRRACRYYGSARLKADSVHWGRAESLGRAVAQLLGCTSWSGGGPGMMQAATLGAARWRPRMD